MRIEKTECNYQVTECDLKFGEQITLDGELLIPISVLDKIKVEIEWRNSAAYMGEYNVGLQDALKIINKYTKSEEKE